jgi:hypothetical protein
MLFRRSAFFAGAGVAVLLIVVSLSASPSARAAFAQAFGFAPQVSAVEPAAEVYTVGYSATDAFHWLDPIAPASGDLTKLDHSLLASLTVDVCQVSGTECWIVKSFTSAGTSAEQLRIITSGQGSYYIVNWDAQKANISRSETYRISVTVPGLQLGSIDLGPSLYNTFGRTWPIKFLVENNPVIRVRIMRHRGKSASLIATALRNEFHLTEAEIAALLADDPEPFTQLEIEVALNGVFQENVIVAPTTKVSDENTSSVLSSFSAETGQLVFATETPFLKNVKAGDVLVGDPTAASPQGYLRKVTSKRKDKGRVILETSQGTLADAVYQGTLDARGDLRAADVDFEEALAPDGTLQRVERQESAKLDSAFQAADVGGGYEFNESFDEEFDFDSGEGDFNGTGKVRVQGSVSFNAGYNFGWGAELCPSVVCVDRVEAHLGVTQTAQVRVTGDLKGHLHKEKVIKRKYYEPIAFMIGPIPVWIVPIVDVVVGTDGNADVRFDFQASVTSQASVGAKWTDPNDGGNDWQRISNLAVLDANANLNDFELNMKLTGYGKGKGKLLIYGVAGPTLDVAVGGGFEFHIPGNPVWKLYGHISGNVAFEVSILGAIDLARFSDNFLLGEPEVRRSGNFAPRFSNVQTTPITARPNEEVYLGPRTEIMPGAYDVMDPESEGFTINAEVLGVTGSPAIPIPDYKKAVFTEPGTKTVRITATDVRGATSDPIFLTVEVLNQPPNVEIYPSTNSIPATAQFFATIIATDPDLPYPSRVGCTTLDIQVSPAATWARRGGSGNCVVWATFDQPGIYTFSVGAADASGGSGGNRSISINVTAAPPNPYPQIIEQTFSVLASEGPMNLFCIPGERCEAPSGVYLSNEEPGSVYYQLPIFMSLSAVDPDGGPAPTVNWVCETGSFGVQVTFVNGEPSCIPAYSSSGPVKVYAVVTDSSGQALRSEPRIYRMLQSGPN